MTDLKQNPLAMKSGDQLMDRELERLRKIIEVIKATHYCRPPCKICEALIRKESPK